MSRIGRWVQVSCFVVAAGLLFAGVAQAQEKAAHKYIGADKCKACHMSEAKGNQYGVWLKSAHAKAYEVLAGEKALAYAKEKAMAKPPQETAECLACHVTGHGKAADLFEVSFKKEQGVSCESCHGPGSDYKDMKIMKDRTAAVAAGLIIPDEKTCTGCHNEKSPTFKGFVYKDMLAKIAHPNPAKAAK
jgi:mono/diheme cytochrome c family protein